MKGASLVAKQPLKEADVYTGRSAEPFSDPNQSTQP